MKRASISALLCAAAMGPAACGEDDEDGGASTAAPPTTTAQAPARTTETKPTGTEVKLQGSDYGKVLFDGRGQAIYLFDKDEPKRSRCFGECADAWPPVYTTGGPRASGGVNQQLLGTIPREGRLQVTYKGQPLYYYAHEGRNEIRCQNVSEFGGLWLVVKGNGEAVR